MIGDAWEWFTTGPVIHASPLLVVCVVAFLAVLEAWSLRSDARALEHAKDMAYALKRIEQLQQRMNKTPW